MKKIGGILAAVLGTALVGGGIAALIKKKDGYVEVDEEDSNDAIEAECEEVVEDSEEE